MNCIVQNCQHKSEYGTPALGFVRCKAHAVVNDTKFPFESCTYQTCLQPALFMSRQSQFPTYCKNHKQDEDIYVLLQECTECKQLFSNSRDGDTLCRPCIDKIQTHIDSFIKQYDAIVTDRSKLQIQLSDKDKKGPLIVLQFIKQDKKDKDPVNLVRLTDLARAIQRPVLVVLCNTGDYKVVGKKASTVQFIDRLPTVKTIIDATLGQQGLNPSAVSVKRIYFDGYIA